MATAKRSTSARSAVPAKRTSKRPFASRSSSAAVAAGDPVDLDRLVQHYRSMLAIRRFEEKAGQLYGMGLIGGFCHLYIGQEAVIVGIAAAATAQDSFITGYRDHGHMIACGMEMRGVMAELTGRRGGYSRGKGGSMHMFSREKNFFGGHGIVGAQVSLGTGLGFAHKYQKDGGVALVFLGDGAVNQGQVYESFNMAALWSLPVIFVIENNQYGMGTSVQRASATTELHMRGQAYGIPGQQVDGMSVSGVEAASAQALAHARGGKGPVILEMMTYRYRGHSMSDPAKYRSKEEVQGVREQRDPIEGVKRTLVEAGHLDEDGLKAIDKKIRAEVNDAAEFAQQSPEPDASELWTDVLVDA